MSNLPATTRNSGLPAVEDAQRAHSSPPTEAHIATVAGTYLLVAIEAAGLRYALMRGYMEDPAQNPGADVDMLLDPGDQQAFEDCLEAACQHSGATIVNTFRTPHTAQFFIHGRTENGRHSVLSLDVHMAESCYGVPYVSAEELIALAEQKEATRFAWEHSGEPVLAKCLPEAWAGLIRFQNGFLSAGEVTEERIQFFANSNAQELAMISQMLKAWYGAMMGSRIALALREGDPVVLERLAKASRRSLWWQRFRKEPVRTIKNFTKTASALRMRPFFKPRGLTVAFLGTDGSGKSTLIDELWNFLGPHYRDGKNSVRKLRPGLLPQINRLIHWRKLSYTAEDCSRPHRANPSGPLGSGFRALWYAADFWLGWPLKILPLRRRNVLLVFDRYYHDFLVDPERARIRLGSRWPKWLSRSVPKPDVMLICVANADRIADRKQELPRPEIHRQVAAYKELARTSPKMHLILTDGTVADSFDQVLCALFPSPSP